MCSYADLDTLLNLAHTGHQVRHIAKSHFVRNVHNNWPWVAPVWSKEAVRIPRQRLKMQKNRGKLFTINETAADSCFIHKDEPVPDNAELLLDPLLPLGYNTLDFRALTLHSSNPPHIPIGGDVNGFLDAMGQLDEAGNTIVTHFDGPRIWGYALENEELIEETLRKATIDEWFYACYRTDESYIVTKHRVLETDISSKPDYMVILPTSDYGEEYEIDVVFSSHFIFVVDKPLEGIDDENMHSYFRLLDMETGSLTTLGHSVSLMSNTIEDLWLEGPFLYLWLSGESEELAHTRVLDTMKGWQYRIVENLDTSGYRTCFRGYTTYDRRVVLDYKNLVAYRSPYEGECVTVGLLDGEIHWWTFPQAEKLYEKHRAARLEQPMQVYS